MQRNKAKVYISCPMNIPQATLTEVHATIFGAGVTKAKYWERGTPYNETDTIMNCDAFIVVLPGLKWDYNIDSIPTGTQKELLLAYQMKKPIYLAHRSKAGMGFYSVDFDLDNRKKPYFIEGINGTSRNLLSYIDGLEEPIIKDSSGSLSSNSPLESYKVVIIDFSEEYDKRLLLG